jgi:asparagine synthase (glutamine-hydrolysing)
MCGITGFINFRADQAANSLEARALEMAGEIFYRGPDDEGAWSDERYGVSLAHRRLSILDLSPTGHQPMASLSGRSVIVYNGEVFNFVEIRHELERDGIRFRGSSDTEVILEACELWGVERTSAKLIGMFAFAFWDARNLKLSLVRDRLGIKPMYWGVFDRNLLFASELKALKVHPAFAGEVNRDALTLYMRHNYIPAPYSIYQGVQKQQPGSIITFSLDGSRQELRFWKLEEVVRAGLMNRRSCTDEEASGELNELLLDAVGKRMVADVPLGAFLSGGVDSSTVVALMQAQSARPVKTFSIGFEETEFDESPYAKSVAAHLGTDHTELIVSPRQAMDVIPRLPAIYDEPFADSSQIPTFLVSQLARQHVTVSLSGDGGDELFAGYGRYQYSHTAWRSLSPLPSSLRRCLAGTIRLLARRQWDAVAEVVPRRYRPSSPGDRLYDTARVLESDIDDVYLRLLSHWNHPEEVVLRGNEPATIFRDRSIRSSIPDAVERMQFLDTMTYLPDDILTKVDRASMSVSLEARVPLLDHRVVEYAWQLPSHMKVRCGQTKWLLREVLYRYVPKQLIERPKMGFGVPIDAWLRGPLKPWAEELLSESRLVSEGFFESDQIRLKWQEHQEGSQNWAYLLWDVLMFQAWLEAQSM